MVTPTPWTAVSVGTGLGSGNITLVDGNTFFVGPVTGDIHGDRVDGLFMLDTRVVSVWRLTLDGHEVEPVSHMAHGPFSVTLIGRSAAAGHVEGDMAVIRRRHVGRGACEEIELRYFGVEARSMVVGVELASDFASLFEVKSGHAHGFEPMHGTLAGAVLTIRPRRPVALSAITARFIEAPARILDGRVEWDVPLTPGCSWSLCVEIGAELHGVAIAPSHRCGEPVDDAVPVNRLAVWRSSVPTVRGDDPSVVRAVDQAIEDLGALRIFDPDHADRVVIAAGAPWFMTLFGRDALLTAWMALLVDHQLAAGVLASLADLQGRRNDPATEEQPGRILHEVRYDTHSARLLGGRNVYYGTVDATPLFVMLVAELARWTGSLEAVAPLLGAVDRAMHWMEHHGDLDGDGFIEYQRPTPAGLENQGWKDSWDGVRYHDGSVATAPIALCEVQGYWYAACHGAALLAELDGRPDVALGHRRRAEDLRVRFDEAFWVEEHGWYAVGLDARKRPIDALSSNIGHCLWSGIVPEDRAPRLAELLVSPQMFNGWGLRTLASSNPGYNPLSYHCGSVWPHDTALAVAGLARYGRDAEAAVLGRALLDASATAGGRLPELFAGFDRSEFATPVPYPASCSPQAWASAAPLLVVRALLGLEPDLTHGVLRLRPRLPPAVTELCIEDLPIGNARARIDVSGAGVEVSGLAGGLEVVVE